MKAGLGHRGIAELKRFVLMIQFLTRFPVPVEVSAQTEDFEKGVVYFPAVGMLIGLTLFGAAAWLFPYVDGLTLAVILVFLEVLLTGGLHLDGLADSFDGLFSYRDKARMLEIMKDSRIGSNGVLVLIFALLMKTALIHALLALQWLMPLAFMPVLSRAMTVFASRISKYARPSGMGNFFIGKVSNLQLMLSLSAALAWMLALSPGLWWVILACMGTTWLFCRFCTGKIDGMTGDTLGANTEMQELLILLLSLMSLKL